MRWIVEKDGIVVGYFQRRHDAEEHAGSVGGQVKENCRIEEGPVGNGYCTTHQSFHGDD